MAEIPLQRLVTVENFDEHAYLASNPDVAKAVASGAVPSGRDHFHRFGHKESRVMRLPPETIAAAKRAKQERIAPLLRDDLPSRRDAGCADFLSEALRDEFSIVDTDNVSANGYDPQALDVIRRVGGTGGLILDCGAGRRAVYFDEVVNFEIVAYDTTDVRGVGEELPFRDASFAAVLSLAVLEHVKDPFRCAAEIARVLKPGGELLCCVPFLQPFHGYPHHYYNMTHEGLSNLFAKWLSIERVDVSLSTLPIWSLSWILRSWAQGLPPKAREEFESLRVAELMGDPVPMLKRPFVAGLPREKNLELASACVLVARKPG